MVRGAELGHFDRVTDPRVLHEAMLQRLAAVEEAVDALSQAPAGIGHNNPPEPMETVALDNEALQAIKAAISTVRALPAVPESPPEKALEAVDEFATAATKTKEYVSKQGDNFVSEIVKEVAKATVTAGVALLTPLAPTFVILYVLADRLFDVADVIRAWLDVIGSMH
jgi:hypothetical protein